MSGNRSGMDPDRYQMRSLKRRVTALEKALQKEQKNSDRLGVRMATLSKRIVDSETQLTLEIKKVLREALDSRATGSSLWDL